MTTRAMIRQSIHSRKMAAMRLHQILVRLNGELPPVELLQKIKPTQRWAVWFNEMRVREEAAPPVLAPTR